MKAWKYLPAEFADGLLTRGEIKVATADHYANLENGRADPIDSKVRKHIADVHFEDGPDEQTMAALNATGAFEVGPDNRRMRISNVTVFHYGPPFFVFCMADTPDLPIDSETAVIEISDIHLFAHRIRMAVPFFGTFAAKPVDYGQVDFPDLEPMSPPNPFKKGVSFSHEREIRIIWSVAENFLHPDHRIVAARRAATLCHRVR